MRPKTLLNPKKMLIWIDEAEKTRLQSLSDSDGAPMSEHIRRALRFYLDVKESRIKFPLPEVR